MRFTSSCTEELRPSSYKLNRVGKQLHSIETRRLVADEGATIRALADDIKKWAVELDELNTGIAGRLRQ